ncbi:MAG: 50S ribosomal protein L19, partial [Bacteroidota bacterium]
MNVIDIVDQMSIERTEDYRKQVTGDNYKEVPRFKAGDTITVAVRVIEGEKERIQNYKGIVLSRRGGGINQTF